MDDVEVAFDREVGGAIADLADGEYLELYEDPNGLTSLVWSTDQTVVDYFVSVFSAIGTPNIDELGILVLKSSNEGVRQFPAHNAIDELTQIEEKVAFCRVDFAEAASTWRALENSWVEEGEHHNQASLVLPSEDLERYQHVLHKAGSPTVGSKVDRVLPIMVRTLRGEYA